MKNLAEPECVMENLNLWKLELGKTKSLGFPDALGFSKMQPNLLGCPLSEIVKLTN